MFFHRSADGDSPTIIEPLRISKRSSTTSPTPSNASLRQDTGRQTSASSGTAYPMPALPYPDGAPTIQTQQQPGRNTVSPTPYPYPEIRTTSPEHNDPFRRAGSAASGETSVSTRLTDGRYNGTLAERRGNSAVKPLPDSPGPEAPDKEGLFQRPPQREGVLPSQRNNPQYPPPSGGGSGRAAFDRLQVHNPTSINRLDSTASNATTKAQRGSPPPPETPIMGPGPGQPQPVQRPQTDIEARYAASGIAGPGTLTAMHAQSLASQQRQASYTGMQPTQQQSQPPARPWTPTELPGSSAHTPAAVYQGADEVTDYGFDRPESRITQQPTSPQRQPVNPLEHDMGRLHVGDEPPPAYSQVSNAPASRYPNDQKRQSSQAGGLAAAATSQIAPTTTGSSSQQQQQSQSHPQPQVYQHPNQHEHPAFAIDPTQYHGPSQTPTQNGSANKPQQGPQRTPSQSLPPASPPPLPEGWIAHLDPNSGQYYYIHLATQSTQWEFPKGPTPLNLDTPLSPTGNVYQNPLASPGLFVHSPLASPGLPLSPGFDQQSVMGLNSTLSNPATLTAQTPISGVELYKVNATNGVYFGPYLRYVNMDLELGIWYGSILLVTDAPQPPTIHIHQSSDLSPNPRQLKAVNIAKHQRWIFFKYDVELRMEPDQAAKWTYAITSHLGCTRYEFLVASRHDTNWRFIVTSGNDFAVGTGQNERARLGGVGYMWKDIMQKHVECGGFHVQLGCGNQIYADRLWKEVPSLKQWLQIRGKDVRKSAVWTAAHEEDVSHAYFHYYTSHFDQPHLREAFAQIPFVATIDDHDM